MESALHLIFFCPYAVRVRNAVSILIGCCVMTPGTSVQHVWESSWEGARANGSITRGDWTAVFKCIWKQCNKVVFDGRLVQPEMLEDRVIQEGRLWLRLGETQRNRTSVTLYEGYYN